jgi:hypothetical protein
VKASVLDLLADNDGALLHWQVPPRLEQTAKEMEKAGEIKLVGELYVHPRAIEIEHGACYTMGD